MEVDIPVNNTDQLNLLPSIKDQTLPESEQNSKKLDIVDVKPISTPTSNFTEFYDEKEKLISVINSILILLPKSQSSKYTNLKNKTKTTLLTILQEIQELNNLDKAVGDDD
ncbi:14911_t:CDS:2, partial [Dentiscutata erythropus]